MARRCIVSAVVHRLKGRERFALLGLCGLGGQCWRVTGRVILARDGMITYMALIVYMVLNHHFRCLRALIASALHSLGATAPYRAPMDFGCPEDVGPPRLAPTTAALPLAASPRASTCAKDGTASSTANDKHLADSCRQDACHRRKFIRLRDTWALRTRVLCRAQIKATLT